MVGKEGSIFLDVVGPYGGSGGVDAVLDVLLGKGGVAWLVVLQKKRQDVSERSIGGRVDLASLEESRLAPSEMCRDEHRPAVAPGRGGLTPTQ